MVEDYCLPLAKCIILDGVIVRQTVTGQKLVGVFDSCVYHQLTSQTNAETTEILSSSKHYSIFWRDFKAGHQAADSWRIVSLA